MTEKKEQVHQICEGRSIIDERQLEIRQWNYDYYAILNFFNKQMSIVRKNISDILASRQLKDSYVAQMIGYDKTQYSKWLNDPMRNLSPSTIVPLSNLLGCSANEIVMGEKKPIALPKLESLIYSIICQQTAYHTECDKLLFRYETTELPYQELIYQRIIDRALDLNVNVQLMLTEKCAEMRPVATRMIETHQFVGRLPTLYCICIFLNDCADYYLCQNYSHCEMTADGVPVEDNYKQTIGKFASLNKSAKHEIVAKMVRETYF